MILQASSSSVDETGSHREAKRRRPTIRSGRRINRRSIAFVHALAVVAILAAACSPDSGESVRFATPLDGDSVTSPVTVEMIAENFVVEPAANGVTAGHGHLHIMIDTPCVEPRLTVPPDDQHLHFGKGQTSAVLDLDPGRHFLCLQAADGSHTALRAVDEITITVLAE